MNKKPFNRSNNITREWLQDRLHLAAIYASCHVYMYSGKVLIRPGSCVCVCIDVASIVYKGNYKRIYIYIKKTLYIGNRLYIRKERKAYASPLYNIAELLLLLLLLEPVLALLLLLRL